MGLVKGKAAYKRWQSGKAQGRTAAIEAHCIDCNGNENVYCGGEASCALYPFSQFSRDALLKRAEMREKSPSREIPANQSDEVVA